MPITKDYQGEIRTLTFGAGTVYEIDQPGIDMGTPETRDRGLERGDRHGRVAAADLLGSRTIAVPIVVHADTHATVGTRQAVVRAAFRPAAGDITLDLRVPGTPATVVRAYGRPRLPVEDQSIAPHGAARLLCRFEALDPLLYGASVVTGPSSGTVNVSNAGVLATDRVTIVVTGNGGTPRVRNPADRDGEIRWRSPLGNGVTRTIDLRARTVVGGSQDRFAELSPLSDWFALEPGTNGLVLTGAASITVTHRPAWI
jgi:hypothetical protein